MPRRQGDFLVEDFYVNTGGLNTNDSPFVVDVSQTMGGKNFDYLYRGAIHKRAGHTKLNAAADAQTTSLGLNLFNPPNASRAVIRAAGRKLQNFDYNANICSNIWDDAAYSSAGTCTITIASPAVVTLNAHGLSVTDPVVFTTSGTLPTGLTAGTTYYVSSVVSANTFQVSATANGASINTSGSQSGTQTLNKFNTTFLGVASTQPVVGAMFTGSANVLWMSGGDMSTIYGTYSTTNATANGVPAPTASSFTASSVGSGGTLTAGKYYYSLVYRKASTQAYSNAVVEASVTAVSNDSINLAWTLSNIDTTKYDKILVYRSSVNGASGFTAGSLVKTLASTATTYTDTGTTEADSQNVPRANNTILDNSVLPSGTYKTCVLFKRRLVTASGSTVYFSDINKSESWPTYQFITVPSGGEITALGVISLTSPLSTDIDEALVVFKQNEMWVITGTGTITGTIPDWSLKFVDAVGSVNQSVLVNANGYIAWVSYLGFWMWNGSGKPVRVSRTIKDKFQQSGDIDKSKLSKAFGFFSKKRNEIQWYLSSNTYGEQNYALKLDLDLTVAGQSSVLGSSDIQGVFTPDVPAFPLYAGLACLTSASATEETIFLGDASGYVYSGFVDVADGGSDIGFQYLTPYLYFGTPGSAKRYNKVVVWVLDTGVDYSLELDYWSDYRFSDSDEAASAQHVSANLQSTGFLWDQGKWDVAQWDGASNRIRPLTFNLSPTNNNNEGDCLRLRLTQTGHLETVLIYGFSVYYTELGLRK